MISYLINLSKWNIIFLAQGKAMVVPPQKIPITS